MENIATEFTPEPIELEQAELLPPSAEHVPTIETPPEAEKPLSLEDALNKAKAEVEAKAEDKTEDKAEEAPKEEKKAEVKEEAKPEKPARERGEDGKFAAKAKPEAAVEPSEEDGGQEQEAAGQSESQGKREAPAQFLPRAKEAFAKADPDLQGEIIRMRDNYEKGITEAKESVAFRKELREFEDMAKGAGTTVKAALANYVAIDTQLRSNPMDGVQRILASINVTPEQYANAVLQQKAYYDANPAEAVKAQASTQIQQLQQELEATRKAAEDARAKAELAALTTSVITPFAAERPRFYELEEDIAFFLNSGKIPFDLSEQERLKQAYDMAVRINPVGYDDEPEARKPSKNAQRPLNPAGSKSVRGNPSAGAFSVANSSKLSLEDAIKKAAAEHRPR